MNPRGAAVVGAGLMGYWHATALARVGIRVTAIVDPREERSQRLQRIHPTARLYRDFKAFLDVRDTDVVHLCTPAALHSAQIRQAVEAEYHVLVEKPLAPTATETQELLELATARGLQLCPVHQFPFQAGVLRLEHTRERIGTIRHVDFHACSAGGIGRSDEERALIAADILPHPLSLLVRLLPPQIVNSITWHSAVPAAGEIRSTGSGNGVTVSILISMAGRPTRNTMRLIGDRGTAHLDLFHGFLVMERGGVSRAGKVLRPFLQSIHHFSAAATNLANRTIQRDPAYPGLRELIRRFHDASNSGDAAPITPNETLCVARAREMILSRHATTPHVGVATTTEAHGQ